MTETIDSLPTRPDMGSDFGQVFNYAVWSPNTIIELCKVPWNNDYRDVVHYDTQASLDAYLDSSATAPILINRLTYARVGDPVRINIPFNLAYKYNYLRVTNPAQPISSTVIDINGNPVTMTDTARTFYYFITDVKYLAPQTTELQLQLDVWQTFSRDMTFGNCYIERGHIGIANTNQMQNNGRDYLTVPEGLNIGDEYFVSSVGENLLGAGAPGGFSTWVMVGIGADLTQPYGTAAAPNLSLAGGASVELMPSGIDILFFQSVSDWELVSQHLSQAPWITETIQFIQVIPAYLNPELAFNTVTLPTALGTVTAYRFNPNARAANYQLDALPAGWRSNVFAADIPSRYAHLNKFLTFPYCVIEVTTYTGNPLVLKPELFSGDQINLDVLQNAAPPSPRWVIVPDNYNTNNPVPASPPTGYNTYSYHGGEYLDVAIHLTDFPQVTILNSGYLNYLASNRNSIAYQHSAADWSQQKALQGVQTDFTQAAAGITNMQQQMGIQQSAMEQSNALNNQMAVAQAVKGTAFGAIEGGARGGGAGALAGGIANGLEGAANAGMAIYQNDQNLAIQREALQRSTAANVNRANIVQDTNLKYGEFAAKGDYQNSINAINAKVQDAKLIQPTSSGQMGGQSFLIAQHQGFYVWTKVKLPTLGIMSMVGEYWLRYGYAINRFGRMPANFQVMDHFTYWKLKETYITAANCPESFKQAIRGIFEKGVTVWSNPADIGTIDIANNNPLTGITL